MTAIKTLIEDCQAISADKISATRALHLMDLTSLNDDDTNETITALCQQAVTQFGHVAALCVYQDFITTVRENLENQDIKIATVVNFPTGIADTKLIEEETKSALSKGANEIDLVFAYNDWLAGKKEKALDCVRICRELCADHASLKIIMETGQFKETASIYDAACSLIELDVQFLKTSTGKTVPGATYEAAACLLQAIKDHNQNIGFKASGGIRTAEQAAQYLYIADQILGPNWVSPQTFRFGASSLLNDLLRLLGDQEHNKIEVKGNY